MKISQAKANALDSYKTFRASLSLEELVKHDEYVNRPLPQCLANPEAKTKDELVGVRTFNPEEISHAESCRRTPKNQKGQSTLSSVTPVKRERAINAFTCTPPAELTEEQKKRVVEIDKLKTLELEEIYIKRKTKWTQKVKEFFGSRQRDEVTKPISWQDWVEWLAQGKK